MDSPAFFRRTYQVVVISSGEPHDDADLEVLAHDLETGDFAGKVIPGPAEPLTESQAIEALRALGFAPRRLAIADEPADFDVA